MKPTTEKFEVSLNGVKVPVKIVHRHYTEVQVDNVNGSAIHNPMAEYDPLMGEKVALGRALKPIFGSDTKRLVKEIEEQIAKEREPKIPLTYTRSYPRNSVLNTLLSPERSQLQRYPFPPSLVEMPSLGPSSLATLSEETSPTQPYARGPAIRCRRPRSESWNRLAVFTLRGGWHNRDGRQGIYDLCGG